MTLYHRLAELQDEQYRVFMSKLVPNLPPERILGVRTPQLRALAKELLAGGEAEAFLAELPHRYLEENLIHFFLLAAIRDFDACAAELDRFLPWVDCWPVSDQATPKCFRKNRQKLLPRIRTWIASEHVYTARFGLRMLMNEFLDEAFHPEYLELAASRQGGDYYLNMMIAWFFATALAKQYDAALPFFETRRLDEWVHRKAIQKAIESFRVTEAHKEQLRRLR